MQFSDRIVLVTGSSRGLGRATALEFARQGAHIAVTYRNSRDLAEGVAEQIRAMGREALCMQVDISNMPDVERLVQSVVERWGRIDVLVNNAGILRDRTLRRMTPQEWSDVLSVNLTGVFNCCHAVVGHMVERGSGRIVSIASVIAHSGGVGQTNYAASKAGIIGLTRSLALELAPKGITVNAVAPGFIKTDMIKTIPNDVLEQIRAKIPLGQFGEPEDIANAVIYLASDAARYVTGHVLNVNGGFWL